jgi:hypothetical protein
MSYTGTRHLGRFESYLNGKRVYTRFWWERKKQLRRPSRSWNDNIKIELREEGWGVNFIYLAQDGDKWRALVNTVINLLVP